jgi:hypothetical protein
MLKAVASALSRALFGAVDARSSALQDQAANRASAASPVDTTNTQNM